MRKETYFKGQITQIHTNLKVSHKKEIIYRLINFGNIYFFAEEISTGCIFPIYCFSSDNQSTNIGFRHYSYIRNGKYFVFSPIGRSDKFFEYKMDELHLKPNSIEVVGRKEVRKYLRSKRSDENWKKEIAEMESQNNYMCDLSVIKDKIKTIKKQENLDSTLLKGTYEEYTPSIDLKEIADFGFDLSEEEQLCNLIGREEEKKKIIKSICINKDSCLLVGPSDTGKTAIVEGIAVDIKNGNNEWLKDKVIFKLDTNFIEMDNKSQTSFREKIKKLIDYCQKYENKIILFIDDIHVSKTIQDKKIDVLNVLKQYISTGDIIIIGTILSTEYQLYLRNDPAFMKMFDITNISLPSLDMNINIVMSYIQLLERNYNIKLELDEEQKYNLVRYIMTLSNYENQKENHLTITTVKNIVKDAFAETIYNKKTSVTLENVYNSLLLCNKISEEFIEDIQEIKMKPFTMVRKIN